MSDAEDSVTIHDEDDVLGVDDDKNADGSDIGNDELGGGDDTSMDDPVIYYCYDSVFILINQICCRI